MRSEELGGRAKLPVIFKPARRAHRQANEELGMRSEELRGMAKLPVIFQTRPQGAPLIPNS